MGGNGEWKRLISFLKGWEAGSLFLPLPPAEGLCIYGCSSCPWESALNRTSSLAQLEPANSVLIPWLPSPLIALSHSPPQCTAGTALARRRVPGCLHAPLLPTAGTPVHLSLDHKTSVHVAFGHRSSKQETGQSTAPVHSRRTQLRTPRPIFPSSTGPGGAHRRPPGATHIGGREGASPGNDFLLCLACWEGVPRLGHWEPDG